ncbi:MAG: hypothetical protein WAU34_05710, partial [Desulfobacterales bacterium]
TDLFPRRPPRQSQRVQLTSFERLLSEAIPSNRLSDIGCVLMLPLPQQGQTVPEASSPLNTSRVNA